VNWKIFAEGYLQLNKIQLCDIGRFTSEIGFARYLPEGLSFNKKNKK